jgi:RNA 2',3'-cyclic 3'-phosphodiesterase
VKLAASVEGRDPLRLFCGLSLPGSVLDPLGRWQREHLGGRIVPRQNVHVTLAFLGSRPRADLEGVVTCLRSAAVTAGPIRFRVRSYRETRSVGMLVLEDETGEAAVLAAALHGLLEELGVYRREHRPWLPHFTVLRFRERPRLQPPLPDLGTFSPSEAAVYHSVLRPTGAQYEILDAVALGG